MHLPHFLIIGAAKAGTTTLYRDLMTNPRLFLPENKEPYNLVLDSVLNEEGRRAYAEHFASASDEQIRGEASTGYTMMPRFMGVAQRAKKVLGPQLKLIYLVREPVARTISHFYHWLGMRHGPTDINLAVREHEDLIACSRYAWQLQPWLDCFPQEQIRVVHFEQYISHRQETIAELSRFLGVPTCIDQINQGVVHNKGEERLVLSRWGTRLQRWPVYKRWVRPLIPAGLRSKIVQTATSTPPPRPQPPSLEVIDLIIESVREDVQRISRFVGAEKLLWDLDAVRRQYTEQADYDTTHGHTQ